MKKKLFIFLLVIFLAHLLFRITAYKDNYSSRFDPEYWKNRYNQSQWVVLNSKNPIGDDGLFAHAAWEYVQGTSPLTIVAGYPPLGIYLLGITILIFKNQNVFAPLVGIMVLVVFFTVNRFFAKDNFIAFLPVLFFSLDPLFYTQLQAPYLDLLHLLFLLLSMYFFLRERNVISSFFLACFALVKFPFLAIVVVSTFLIWLLLQKNYTRIKRYIISLLVIPVIYTGAHIQYFLLGNNLWDFLAAQKWIVHYYSIGAKATPGIIFPMIFSGTWYTWWNGIIKIDEWTILWPAIFTISIVYSFYSLFVKKQRNLITIVSLWIAFYLAFLSIIPVSPRYLLLLLPFMYNLAIWVLSGRINGKSFYS